MNTKIAALDIGDAWTGIALSDALGMFARPLTTIKADEIEEYLRNTLLKQEPVGTIVVGHPKTMRGTISDQTRKIENSFADLQQKFPTVTWILWDERLSSKRALPKKKPKDKRDKVKIHARAAAFILSSYLDHVHLHKNMPS